MSTHEELVQRYVAMWNEADPEARRAAVRELWAEDGIQVLKPPEELLANAAALGFVNPVLEARGHAELDARVTRAHEEFVAPGEFRFRARQDPVLLGSVMRFGWEMVATKDGEAVAAGTEFAILDASGRIRADYQFIER
jgi:hypothetical protein